MMPFSPARRENRRAAMPPLTAVLGDAGESLNVISSAVGDLVGPQIREKRSIRQPRALARGRASGRACQAAE